MAGLVTENFNAAMKLAYMGPLNDTVFRRTPFLARVEKTSQFISGDFAVMPLISGRNPAVGGRKDPDASTSQVGPKLPEAGRQAYAKATYTMGLHYGRGSVSGSTKRKTRDKMGAFAEALDEEMKGLLKSLPEDLNRQVCGWGDGRAATLDVDQATSDVITIEARDGFIGRIGDRVGFADRTAGTGITPTNGTTITAISFNTATNVHTVTLAAASGTSLTAADDAMYFGAATSMTAEDMSRGQEIYGIQAIVDDGDIGDDKQQSSEAGEVLSGPGGSGSITKMGGITRSSNAFWQSTVLTNPVSAGTLRPVTETLLMEASLTLSTMHGIDESEVELWTGPAMFGTVGMTQVGTRVFNDFKETVEFGFTAIIVNGSKMFKERDLPNDAIFWITMKYMKFLTQNDYEFLDDDGGVIRMVAGGGRDAWEFSINRDAQLATNNGRAHLKLKDLKSSMTITGALH